MMQHLAEDATTRSAPMLAPPPAQRNRHAGDVAPPSSLEAEAGCLGCCLLDPSCLATLVQRLGTDEAFYDLRHRVIYQTMLWLSERGQVVDTVSVIQRLRDTGQLDEAGGIALVSGLPDATPSPANVEWFCGVVAQKATLRRAQQVCRDAVERIQTTDDVAGMLDDLERDVLAIRPDDATTPTAQALTRLVLSDLEGIHERQGALLGLSTGIPDLDNLTDGLKAGDMMVVAARPSVGKTSLALNIAEHVAMVLKRPVGIFSLEMTARQLMMRLLLSLSRVDVQNLRRGFTERDFPKLSKSAIATARAPIFIDDASDLTILQLRSRARRMRQRHKVELLVVDYLQLLKSSQKRAQNREQEVADISGGLKALGKELDVPVLVCAQLNRDLEKTKGAPRRPRCSDLRECLAVKDSFLFASDGIRCNADSLMNLYALKDGKIKIKPSDNVPKLSADTIRVTLRSGRTITCTKRHKILTDLGWIEAQHLTEHHAVASVRRLPSPAGLIKIPEAKWIGWMLGNGSMVGYASPSFICSCDAVADSFCKVTEKLFGLVPKPHHHSCKAVKQFDITASSVRTSAGNPVKDWLKQHDLWGKKAPEKTIPDWFLQQADNESIAELLAGLIETDGSVFYNPSPVVKYSTTSRLMAIQVVWCFNRLGIFVRMDGGLMNSKSTTPCYGLLIHEGLEIINFRNKISIIGRKGDVLNGMEPTTKGSNYGDRLGSWVSKEIGTIAKENGISQNTLGYTDQGRRISQKDLTEVLRKLSVIGVSELYDERIDKLRSLINEDIFWDRLKHIKPSGHQAVFDREVPSAGNFVCNGVVVHNSGKIEGDADMIWLLHERVDEEDEEQRNPTVEVDLIVGKNRNGPKGTVRLVFLKSITRFEQAPKIHAEDVPKPK